MRVLLVLGALALLSPSLAQERAGDCGECDPDLCSQPGDCLAGLALDRCGCCEVCAKAEYELCDHPELPTNHGLYGRCGENLECRLRTDLKKVKEALCYCTMQDVLCGTDDKTYDNICDLMANAVAKNKKIKVKATGRCEDAPIIVSGPGNQKNQTGSDVVLQCESKGRPIPTIEWTWTNVNGDTIFLPSDDMRVSSNMRGGPEKWEVTGWLQIMDIQKEHEGDYTCISQNKFGVAQAGARVIVEEEETSNEGRKARKMKNDKRFKNEI